MAQADRDESAVDAGVQLRAEDKVVICLIVFFTAVALTLELYWLMFNQAMENRTDWLARALALYWPADSTYRVPGRSVAKSFTLALEGVNTFITPWLSLVLVWAILKRRHALQLTSDLHALWHAALLPCRAYFRLRGLREQGRNHIPAVLPGERAVVCGLCLDGLGRLSGARVAARTRMTPP